jgi:hypothetical protein
MKCGAARSYHFFNVAESIRKLGSAGAKAESLMRDARVLIESGSDFWPVPIRLPEFVLQYFG